MASADTKPVLLVKALLDSHNTLLEDLQKLSVAINQAIDMSEFISGMDAIKLSHPILQVNLGTTSGEVLEQGKPQNCFEVIAQLVHYILILFLKFYNFWLIFFINITVILEQNAEGSLDFRRDLLLCSLSEENLMKIFDFLGNKVFFLWNMFLNFHRFAFILHYLMIIFRHL